MKAKDPEKIAAAQQSAAQTLQQRAAGDPEVAAVILAAHRELSLWSVCAERACQRGKRCCGDEIACAARFWPVAASCLEDVAVAAREGRSPAQTIAQHLSEWIDEGGLLTRVIERQVMWEG
jgi:hypothetical protein